MLRQRDDGGDFAACEQALSECYMPQPEPCEQQYGECVMGAQSDEELLQCEAFLQECLGNPMPDPCQAEAEACYANAMTMEEYAACDQALIECQTPQPDLCEQQYGECVMAAQTDEENRAVRDGASGVPATDRSLPSGGGGLLRQRGDDGGLPGLRPGLDGVRLALMRL